MLKFGEHSITTHSGIVIRWVKRREVGRDKKNTISDEDKYVKKLGIPTVNQPSKLNI